MKQGETWRKPPRVQSNYSSQVTFLAKKPSKIIRDNLFLNRKVEKKVIFSELEHITLKSLDYHNFIVNYFND